MADEDQPPEIQTGETTEVETPKPDNGPEPTDTKPEQPAKKPNFLKRFWANYKTKKKVSIPLTVLAILTLLMIIPTTRYAILGLFVKHDVDIQVLDNRTNAPVSGVNVTIHGQTVISDSDGIAAFSSVKIGPAEVTATKTYYKDASQSISVGWKKDVSPPQVKIEATGRQIPIHVTNKITGADLAGAIVKTSNTQVQTDDKGLATMVLAADADTVQADISLSGYNTSKVSITVDEKAVKENSFTLAPAGKIYFLSKRTGKINLMKSDLDGQNQKVVWAGTGKEEDTNTILLASRDWKYLAFLSRRAGTYGHLYLVDTSNDKTTEMDGGDAVITLVGWSDHNFIYKVDRQSVKEWQPNRQALKSYNADTSQLTVVDQTDAKGTSSDSATEQFSDINLLSDEIVYSKYWYGSEDKLAGERMGIYTAHPSGAGRQLVKDFPTTGGYISSVLAKPDKVYFSISTDATTYYVYENGSLTNDSSVTSEDYYAADTVYLASPNLQKTFWYEERDGKNALFVGDANAGGAKEIADLSEYKTYGWYTDNYLLVSKDDSELYILPVAGAGDKGQILKITDYHKPSAKFYGYGGGYGGI